MFTKPSDAEIIMRALESRIGDIFCNLVGQITAYDRDTQTCSVQIVTDRPCLGPDDATVNEPFPELTNVPVLFPRSASVGIVWDLEPGDSVALMVQSLSLTQWRKSGQTGPVGDLRTHHPGSVVALPGIGPNASPIPYAKPGGVVIEGPKIWLGKDAEELIARADRVEQAFQSHTHSIPSGTDAAGGTSGPGVGYGSVGCDKVYGK